MNIKVAVILTASSPVFGSSVFLDGSNINTGESSNRSFKFNLIKVTRTQTTCLFSQVSFSFWCAIKNAKKNK